MFSTLTLVVVLTTSLAAGISVGPIRKPARPGCVSNKIAPHRLTAAASYRTFGYFYDLLVDDGGGGTQADLEGCEEDSEIDDEGDDAETGSTGKSDPRNRFWNWFGNGGGQATPRPPRPPRPPHDQQTRPPPVAFRPPQRPPSVAFHPSDATRPPQRPPPVAFRPPGASLPPPRPPYHSGGPLAHPDRPHAPPRPEYPSDFVKPVYEAQPYDQQPAAWRPAGGGSGGVGAPVSPPSAFQSYRPQQAHRPRLQGGGGIVGSFIDLFFK